jgi:hypothetical protein
MATPLSDSSQQSSTQVWQHLKQAIAESSGFKRWRLDRKIDDTNAPVSLDYLVHRYLRETLETLAY